MESYLDSHQRKKSSSFARKQRLDSLKRRMEFNKERLDSLMTKLDFKANMMKFRIVDEKEEEKESKFSVKFSVFCNLEISESNSILSAVQQTSQLNFCHLSTVQSLTFCILT